jgi:hypothetical protein
VTPSLQDQNKEAFEDKGTRNPGKHMLFDIDARPNPGLETIKIQNALVDFATHLYLLVNYSKREHVIIHCLNSRSRSPSVLLAYFVLFRGIQLEKAKKWLHMAFQSQRPIITRVSSDVPKFFKFEDVIRSLKNYNRLNARVRAICKGYAASQLRDARPIVSQALIALQLTKPVRPAPNVKCVAPLQPLVNPPFANYWNAEVQWEVNLPLPQHKRRRRTLGEKKDGRKKEGSKKKAGQNANLSEEGISAVSREAKRVEEILTTVETQLS